ncbi:glycosyltransferase family 2 protein [Saccharicrinis aurantiacus]|uniref:glycosyltransferase family 2 protein n=1 Tax=Saccharicrinis aurantiacus TaxID=1849719 RepID=UPI0024925C19|nr:glycosyltransferase family 2 protein [Saccharicrinis aurantiacus]
MTTVAIVILNWNGEKLLKEFIPTVVKNSHSVDFKIYVADNASTDNSVCYLENKHPEIEIIKLDKNYGFTGGYNRALKQIESKYYILLNSDVAPANNWLEPLVFEMETHDNIAVCVPKIKSYKEPKYFEYAGAAGGHIDKYGFPFCEGRIFNKIEEDTGQYNTSKNIFWASGAALMTRANIFHEVGGLDEDFFAHMEEIDLCWRLKNRGWKVKYIAESEVYHLGGATLDYSDPRKVYLNFRNNLFLLTKNLPRNKWLFKLIERMIIDGIAALKFLASLEIKNFWSVLKAHLSFYKHLPLFYKKRRKNLKYTTQNKHPEIYQHSIVFQFFFRGIRKYSDLRHKI